MENIKFDNDGLIPVVVQDYKSLDVIMVACMDKKSIEKTIKTGLTWFYSRSRKKYWQKGETSGNIQVVKEVKYDCDRDTLLVLVEQKGVGCHTGEYSCFHNDFFKADDFTAISALNQINKLFLTIEQRKKELPDNSYTAKLMENGLDKILEKVKEESGEVAEAATIKEKPDLIWEIADLIYHLAVLAVYKDISLEDINSELKKRSKQIYQAKL